MGCVIYGTYEYVIGMSSALAVVKRVAPGYHFEVIGLGHPREAKVSHGPPFDTYEKKYR